MAQIKRKHASRKHINKLIEREVSFFNGWMVSEETMHAAIEAASTKILRYLGKKPKSKQRMYCGAEGWSPPS